MILTPKGREMLAVGGSILNAIHCRWGERVGKQAVDDMERHLRILVGDGKEAIAIAGWLAKTSG